MAVLPMRRPNPTAVLTTCAAVRPDGITSSNGIRATGEKKCIPTTCSGRLAASAIRWIGIVDVLDANTASGAVAASTSRSTCCLTWRSSRSEEHTSELQSRSDLVCRLLLEKKKRTLLSASVFHYTTPL